MLKNSVTPNITPPPQIIPPIASPPSAPSAPSAPSDASPVVSPEIVEDFDETKQTIIIYGEIFTYEKVLDDMHNYIVDGDMRLDLDYIHKLENTDAKNVKEYNKL